MQNLQARSTEPVLDEGVSRDLPVHGVDHPEAVTTVLAQVVTLEARTLDRLEEDSVPVTPREVSRDRRHRELVEGEARVPVDGEFVSDHHRPIRAR